MLRFCWPAVVTDDAVAVFRHVVAALGTDLLSALDALVIAFAAVNINRALANLANIGLLWHRSYLHSPSHMDQGEKKAI
jgi:hypothetical protein